MKKNELIKLVEDAVTDMEYRHFINPDFDLNQKWSITLCAFDDDFLDAGRISIKKNKKGQGYYHF